MYVFFSPEVYKTLEHTGTQCSGDVVVTLDLRLSQLSPARQALVRYCQALNHGCIEELRVAGGEPVFDSATVIVTDHRRPIHQRHQRPGDQPDGLQRLLFD